MEPQAEGVFKQAVKVKKADEEAYSLVTHLWLWQEHRQKAVHGEKRVYLHYKFKLQTNPLGKSRQECSASHTQSRPRGRMLSI